MDNNSCLTYISIFLSKISGVKPAVKSVPNVNYVLFISEGESQTFTLISRYNSQPLFVHSPLGCMCQTMAQIGVRLLTAQNYRGNIHTKMLHVACGYFSFDLATVHSIDVLVSALLKSPLIVSKQLLVNTGLIFRSCQSVRVCTAYCWLLSGLTLRCTNKPWCLVLLKSLGFCCWLVHWLKQLLENFVVPLHKAGDSMSDQLVISTPYLCRVTGYRHDLNKQALPKDPQL